MAAGQVAGLPVWEYFGSRFDDTVDLAAPDGAPRSVRYKKVVERAGNASNHPSACSHRVNIQRGGEHSRQRTKEHSHPALLLQIKKLYMVNGLL